MVNFRWYWYWLTHDPKVLWVIAAAIVAIIVYRQIKAGGAKLPDQVLSHWNHMVEELKQPSNDFYNEIAARLQKHELKNLDIRRVNLREGGIFSARREYLQVRSEKCVYHACAAPYGNGFFVSSWLGEMRTGFWAWVAQVPFLGAVVRLFKGFFWPVTYYRIDTAEMFHAVVHSAVTGAFNATLSAQGKKELTESQAKPVMRDLFARL